MAEIFLSIMRGNRLSQEVPQPRVDYCPLGSSPSIFFSTTPGTLMNINPTYKDVPSVQEKVKHLNLIIDCQRSSVALWESEMPKYELLPKVKEQLARNEKLLKEVTGTQSCQ